MAKQDIFWENQERTKQDYFRKKHDFPKNQDNSGLFLRKIRIFEKYGKSGKNEKKGKHQENQEAGMPALVQFKKNWLVFFSQSLEICDFLSK